MKKTAVTVAAVLSVGALSFLPFAPGASATSATPRSIDLAVTGSVVGGETYTDSTHLLAFSFKVTNKSTRSLSATVDLTFSPIRHATVADIMCVIPATHFGADPDGGTTCEITGPLGAGKSEYATVILQSDTANSSVVSIRGCSSNEGGIPDPVTSNNCKTLSVHAD